MHLDRPTLAFEPLAVPDRVVKENVVLTHMHSDRGQTGQIAVKRGRQGIVRVPACQIEPRQGGKLRRRRERVGVRPGHHALAGQRQVGPSRYHRRALGNGTGAAARLGDRPRKKDQGETAAGRVARKRYVCKSFSNLAFVDQPVRPLPPPGMDIPGQACSLARTPRLSRVWRPARRSVGRPGTRQPHNHRRGNKG